MGKRNHRDNSAQEQVADKRCAIFAPRVGWVRYPSHLAQSLAQVDEAVERVIWLNKQRDGRGKAAANVYNGNILTAGEDNDGVLTIRQDKFL